MILPMHGLRVDDLLLLHTRHCAGAVRHLSEHEFSAAARVCAAGQACVLEAERLVATGRGQQVAGARCSSVLWERWTERAGVGGLCVASTTCSPLPMASRSAVSLALVLPQTTSCSRRGPLLWHRSALGLPGGHCIARQPFATVQSGSACRCAVWQGWWYAQAAAVDMAHCHAVPIAPSATAF